jgi:hypothetical protein
MKELMTAHRHIRAEMEPQRRDGRAHMELRSKFLRQRCLQPENKTAR